MAGFVSSSVCASFSTFRNVDGIDSRLNLCFVPIQSVSIQKCIPSQTTLRMSNKDISNTVQKSAHLSTCIRCGNLFNIHENHSNACNFHGDICGNTMNYNLYEDHHFDDPSLDNKPGPRFAGRWGCCQETIKTAEPCKQGWHLTYDNDSELRMKDISLTFPY